MEYEITTTCYRFLRKATLDADTPMCDIFPCETCGKKDICGLFSVNGVYYGEHFFSSTLGELLAHDEHASSYYIMRLKKQYANPSITKESEGVFRLHLTHGGYIPISRSELAHLYESIGRVLDSET